MRNKTNWKITQINFRPGYIKFECYASMLFSINRFSESFERDRIQLKDVQ